MAGSVPTSVLSEALEKSIAGRRVKAAVFTTFSFEPGFFEEEVLPLLFEFTFSHAPKVRLVQLEDELRSVEHLAVYYDRRALVTGGLSATLDYARIPIERKGCFHPKLALILLENEVEEWEDWDSLLVGVFSANLTQSAWWENVECAQFEEVQPGEQCRFRRDLMGFFGWLRQDEQTGDDHGALEQIRRFVVYQTSDLPYRTAKGIFYPRLFFGQQGLPDFLRSELKLSRDTYNLEVISPFFDETAEAGTLADLIDAVQPRETRVYLPRADDGTAHCSEAFFEAVSSLPATCWATLPRAIVRRSQNEGSNESDRFVHAKVYRLWSKTEGKEFLISGSVNLTRAGHSRAAAGNLEAAWVTQSAPNTFQTRFWLEALEDSTLSEFQPSSNEDEPEDRWVPPLSIRYNWTTGTGSYFWEASAPERFGLSSAGSSLGTVTELIEGAWTNLPGSITTELGRVLAGTSFIDVTVEGHDPGTILVRETGMAQKPSLLLTLTPEEILRYWSLLSPEQRAVVIETKIGEISGWSGPTKDRPGGVTTDSMFDRFAGIFHAFARLEGQVSEELERGNERDANYRLFGEKYDSLPNLVKKVIEDEEGDLVNRFVTLLTARQLLSRLRKSHPAFFEEQSELASRLEDQLTAIEQLKKQIVLPDDIDRTDFFDWYEKSFLWHAREAGIE